MERTGRPLDRWNGRWNNFGLLERTRGPRERGIRGRSSGPFCGQRSRGPKILGTLIGDHALMPIAYIELLSFNLVDTGCYAPEDSNID